MKQTNRQNELIGGGKKPVESIFPQTLVKPNFNQSRLDEFWNFITERQKIWYSRFVRKKLPPWTNDKVLCQNHFTNVYRELDPGTKYAIEHILELRKSKKDRIFNIMIYRLIGKEETHRYIGFQYVKKFDSTIFVNNLNEIKKQGMHPFTSAYMVSAYNSMGSKNKITNISRIFTLLKQNIDGFYYKLITAPSMEKAYKIISGQPGYGNFLSYQILVDLTYPLKTEGGIGLIDLPAGDWASAGPGARNGIKILLKTPFVSDLTVMKWLRDMQREEFRRLMLAFPFWKNEYNPKGDISLSNIQNCLCEYYKYVKIKEGWGRGRRRFNPQTSITGSKMVDTPQQRYK